MDISILSAPAVGFGSGMIEGPSTWRDGTGNNCSMLKSDALMDVAVL